MLNHRRKVWLEAQLPHQEALVDAVADADYRRFKDFYSADPGRRGDDTVVGEIGDLELVWSVVFIPRTSEVVAFALRWLDEYWHSKLYGLSGPPNEYFAGKGTLGPLRTPELVVVLGRAQSAEAATTHVASATTLAAVRARLRAA